MKTYLSLVWTIASFAACNDVARMAMAMVSHTLSWHGERDALSGELRGAPMFDAPMRAADAPQANDARMKTMTRTLELVYRYTVRLFCLLRRMNSSLYSICWKGFSGEFEFVYYKM